jgi:outer membrane protein assembly factor BamD (BamD/ComL family)
VVWTPNINFLDPEGNIFYHVEGWLPPSDYSAMLMVAHAHYFLHHKNFQKARDLFQTVWDKYPQSEFAPEALYYLGVSRYKDSNKGDELIEGWRVLQRFHPESTWAIRSSVL